MKRSPTGKQLLIAVFLVLSVSVALSLISFLPATGTGTQTTTIIDDSFKLTPKETYHQGLGSFHGDENITIRINQNGNTPANFTLLTYTGARYNSTAFNVNYSFPVRTDYYEAVFQANAETTVNVHLQVAVEKPTVDYKFSWLGAPAKALFIASWVASMIFLLKPAKAKIDNTKPEKQQPPTDIEKKNWKLLKIGVLISLAFWIVLLVLNANPLATFENWYTDAARHPYTATLFTKVGFSVFDTPLGALSSVDGSVFKFVSWAEMPHLYPLGSIFLFLPFGALLEGGVSQVLVFKLEVATLIVVAHACLYLFLKRFWKQELTLTPREVWSKPFWKQEVTFSLKVFSMYLLYIVLVVYSANGQFDAVAFLFSLAAISMFLKDRHDYFLLLVAVSCIFKYQAGIFLAPLALVSVIELFKNQKPFALLKNKVILAALGFAAVDISTAILSTPFLLTVRPELVMNGVNAFSPHAQTSWTLQAFTVLLTLGVTLVCAIYLLNRNRPVSLFAIFSLLPIFSMPYFQPWYLPFFFVYPLIPQSKQSLRVTLVWLAFMAFVLSFGGLSYNPLAILDNIRRILQI
jgi:hypothetical protein